MPEIRYIDEYDNQGNVINRIPYEVSDEELYQEQLRKEMNDIHEKAILAYKNWGALDKTQKDTILKGLVKWALWQGGWLKLGTL